ncbi:hypothetical protein BD410DRAFT_847075 [Rickenella mellea]|uniref:Uncharacterized protein n=1 Tax=Rickenella mellea TaxID=50990 RepID=A0A4Y7PDH2_9AGAM|nr:hypothetical protein BD410DRAFT_847075 [Rickenella mellea]
MASVGEHHLDHGNHLQSPVPFQHRSDAIIDEDDSRHARLCVMERSNSKDIQTLMTDCELLRGDLDTTAERFIADFSSLREEVTTIQHLADGLNNEVTRMSAHFIAEQSTAAERSEKQGRALLLKLSGISANLKNITAIMEKTKDEMPVFDSTVNPSFLSSHIKLLQQSSESNFRAVIDLLAVIVDQMPRKVDLEDLQTAVKQLAERVYEVDQGQSNGPQPIFFVQPLDEELTRIESDFTSSSWGDVLDSPHPDSPHPTECSMNGPADVFVPPEAERVISCAKDPHTGDTVASHIFRGADGWWGPDEKVDVTVFHRARVLFKCAHARIVELTRDVDVFWILKAVNRITFLSGLHASVQLYIQPWLPRWWKLMVVVFLLCVLYAFLGFRSQPDVGLWDDYDYEM